MRPETLAKIYRFLLSLRRFRLFVFLYDTAYRLATFCFVRTTVRLSRGLGFQPVSALYLRRGGGRGELVAGASDLDFFLVLNELTAAQEMQFLQVFWRNFRRWKKVFPFLGETLMADENELRNWICTPTVRSFESHFSWRCLWGNDVLQQLQVKVPPDLRDLLSECAKYYWMILEPIIKEGKLDSSLKAHQQEAVHLRHAAKAALDLFRIHYSFATAAGRNPTERERLWPLTRTALTDELAALGYGEELRDLKNLLLLKDPLFSRAAPLDLFPGIVMRAYDCLDDIARQLEGREETFTEYKVFQSKTGLSSETFVLAVRELMAERIIERHKGYIRKVIVADETSHIFLPLFRKIGLAEMRLLIEDLRGVGESFSQFSAALPLSEATLRELEKTSFLDSPFHAFYTHQEISCSEGGQIVSKNFVPSTNRLPTSMLEKTFAEVSLALRFQPAPNFTQLVEKTIAVVVALRLARDFKEIATDFQAAVASYSEKYPTRAEYLKSQVSRYFHLRNQEEEKLWDELLDSVSEFSTANPLRAELIKAQIQGMKRARYSSADSHSRFATTDLWIDMSPFLRLEMNSLKEYFYEHRAKLKV